MTINTMEEYLKFRDMWRCEYKELSSRIRETKQTIKDLFRKGDVMAGTHQFWLIGQKESARDMMELRAESKIRANEIWCMTHS